MTLQNITITTINNTDLYFLKADGSDFIQAPISETTHIGVLRYAPTEAGTYQGEVYANASALKQYQKFPVSLTVLNVLTVDVFVSITDPSDDPDYAGWFQVGKGLPVVGTSFGLLESDVPVNSPLWVMVKDSVNAGVYDISVEHQIQGVVIIISLNDGTDMELEGIYTEDMKYFYGTNGEIVDSTDEDRTEIFYGIGNADGMIDLDIKTIEVSINIPIELIAGAEGNVEGEHTGGEGWFVDVYSRVSGGTPDENEWEVFQEGVEVQADGTWTATGTIADAGTRDFMAIDTLVNASDEVDDVVVASGTVIPTTNVYDSWSSDTLSSTSNVGDVFVHRGNSDIVVALESYSGLWCHHYSMSGKTRSTYYTNTATGWYYKNADSIDSNDAHHLSALNYTAVARNRYTANNNNSSISNYSDEKVGIINIDGTMHVLLSNGKLYTANSNYSTLTEVGTLPGVGANTTRKSMAYDSSQNILFVLEGTKIYCISLDGLSLLETLTIPSGRTGIVHYNSRLVTVHSATSYRINFTIYKNSNDA